MATSRHCCAPLRSSRTRERRQSAIIVNDGANEQIGEAEFHWSLAVLVPFNNVFSLCFISVTHSNTQNNCVIKFFVVLEFQKRAPAADMFLIHVVHVHFEPKTSMKHS